MHSFFFPRQKVDFILYCSACTLCESARNRHFQKEMKMCYKPFLSRVAGQWTIAILIVTAHEGFDTGNTAGNRIQFKRKKKKKSTSKYKQIAYNKGWDCIKLKKQVWNCRMCQSAFIYFCQTMLVTSHLSREHPGTEQLVFILLSGFHHCIACDFPEVHSPLRQYQLIWFLVFLLQ